MGFWLGLSHSPNPQSTRGIRSCHHHSPLVCRRCWLWVFRSTYYFSHCPIFVTASFFQLNCSSVGCAGHLPSINKVFNGPSLSSTYCLFFSKSEFNHGNIKGTQKISCPHNSRQLRLSQDLTLMPYNFATSQMVSGWVALTFMSIRTISPLYFECFYMVVI